MSAFFKSILARLEESSTWAGGGIGAVLLGALVPGTTGQAVLHVVAAAAAALAIIIPEKAK